MYENIHDFRHTIIVIKASIITRALLLFRFLQRVLLDYLAVNGGETDHATMNARHFYICQWYRDANASTKKAKKAKKANQTNNNSKKNRKRRKDSSSESSEEEV